MALVAPVLFLNIVSTLATNFMLANSKSIELGTNVIATILTWAEFRHNVIVCLEPVNVSSVVD